MYNLPDTEYVKICQNKLLLRNMLTEYMMYNYHINLKNIYNSDLSFVYRQEIPCLSLYVKFQFTDCERDVLFKYTISNIFGSIIGKTTYIKLNDDDIDKINNLGIITSEATTIVLICGKIDELFNIQLPSEYDIKLKIIKNH